jgi:predicted Zn finger-like uncharacterized protein
MPIPTTCPHCKTAYSLADQLRGKKVRCKVCSQVLLVGSSGPPPVPVPQVPEVEPVEDEPAAAPDGIRVVARRAKRPPESEEAPMARVKSRRREEDDDWDEPRPRRRRRSNKGLVIGLVAGGVGLVVVAVAVVLVIVLAGGDKDQAGTGSGGHPGLLPDLTVNLSGRWPEALPLHGFRQNIPPTLIVTVHVAAVADMNTREAVEDKIGALVDPGTGSAMSAASEGDRLTVLISPVRDPKAFADRIDFGVVRSVDGRVVTVVARKVDGPPDNADPITRELYHLQSFSNNRRMHGVRRLKELQPDGRREEGARALAALLQGASPGDRDVILETLGVWGTKETLPILLDALGKPETRKAALRALGYLKDESTLETIADCLSQADGQGEAVQALKVFGPAAEDTVLKRLNHPEHRVREVACQILKDVGTQKSLPALQRIVDNKERGVEFWAKVAIDEINRRLARQGAQ